MQDLDRIWISTDPQGSELNYRQLLPAAEALNGAERFYLIDLHSLIARCELSQKKFSDARSSLETAERYLNEIGSSCPASSKLQWLIEMGRLQILEKAPSQARVRFVEAWTLALQSKENRFASEIALLMATIEPQKQQQEWITQGIELAEKSTQPGGKRWLGHLYASLGSKLFDLRQYDDSLKAFEKSLSHFQVEGSTVRETLVARWSIGKLLRTLGRVEEALSIQNALLAELDATHAKDGRVFQELAECLHSLKKVPEAQVYFDLAYRELSREEAVVDNQPAVLKRLKELGKSK